ncbi:MAG: nucleoside hydrolase [Anaerolineae bacterium]|nr:nucleoside hydrolase [Anaerolineae bacterium]
MRSFIIDTDTASDDAVALIMALRAPDVDVKAITTVAGNVPLEQCTINALYTSELCGSEVPVYPGADKPLIRVMEYGDWFHGIDGLGEMNYPPPKRAAQSEHAVDALIRVIRENPGIVLVTLGPLTNVAMAVSKAPDIVQNVSRCVLMGGAANTIGNVTPAAEFNIWVDPEAARIVFHSGLPIEMVGWELCRFEANLTLNEIAMVRGFETDLAEFSMDCNRRALEANLSQSGDPGLGLPDPVTMAIALDPTICTRKSTHHVDIETQSDLTRGMTVVDEFNLAADPRNHHTWLPLSERAPGVSVCWEIDIPRWKEALYQSLR